MFSAHNVVFENTVLSKSFSLPKKIRWHCTMAKCHAAGLPPALKNAALALGITKGKKDTGKDLIEKYSLLDRKTGEFNPIPHDDMLEWLAYCKQDINTAMAVDNRIPNTLDRAGRLMATLDMNLRGMPIDVDLAQRVVDTLVKQKELAADELPINTNSTKQMLSYCSAYGVSLPNVTIQTVDLALRANDLPKPVRDILLARQSGSKTSTKKYTTMLALANRGRIQEGFQYHGAHTGRDSGRGVQPQNLPRGTLEDSVMLEYIDDADMVALYGKTPSEIAKGGLRSIIRSSKGLICSDFAEIETRVLFWLANDKHLEMIKSGLDLYIKMAADIYAIEYNQVTRAQRAVGKAAVLGLGFGMGSGFDKDGAALQDAKGAYRGFKGLITAQGLDVPDSMIKKAVALYRGNFIGVTGLWDKFDMAYRKAMRGEITRVRGCTFKKLGKYYMSITLPSGRRNLYFYPSIEDSDQITYLSGKSPLSKAARDEAHVAYSGISMYKKKLYGGRIVQNVVQSVARDVLFDAFDRLTDAGYELIGRFHDELLAEKCSDSQCLDEFNQIMKIVPDWA
ncbi:MAG: DNA polymerase, partial [Gammaproteobacteria bacterium]